MHGLPTTEKYLFQIGLTHFKFGELPDRVSIGFIELGLVFGEMTKWA